MAENPRLFDLVHDGGHHESLSIHAYGGELFRPGVGGSDDAVLRSLHAFEHEKATLDDGRVLHPSETQAVKNEGQHQRKIDLGRHDR